MRAPVWYRKLKSRYSRPVPSTAEVRLEGSPGQVGSLAHARGRLAHQIKQAEKWEGRFKFGQHNGLSRQELKVKSETIRARVSIFEAEFQRLGGDLREFYRLLRAEQ